MGCFKSRLTASRKRPLPSIPHPQASIIDLHRNQPLPQVPKFPFQSIAHSNSIVSSISAVCDVDQRQQSSNATESQINQRKTIKSTKKKGFPWTRTFTWTRRSKLIDYNLQSSTNLELSERNPVSQQRASSKQNERQDIKSNNSSISCKLDKPKTKIVITLYPYDGRNHIELSFQKNEKFVIVDDKQSDWWLAFKWNLPEIRGFIPMNFVKIFDIDDEEWFFSKISRRSAERLLLKPDYPRGTFLIRNSEKDQGALLGAYTLSIRDFSDLKLDHVKHYKIQIDSNGDFFITTRRSFVEIQDLIQFYSTSEYGLCHRLTKPCPKIGNYSFFRDDEIDRRELKFVRELGSGNFGKVYFGIYRGKTKVAVKTLKPGSMTPAAFMQEAAIMRRYRHSKLLQLYGVCSAGLPLMIVTEFMSKGALLNYLRDNQESSALTIVDLIEMASQIAAGMTYLEQVKLVHRDLAARNCLVSDNRVVKVADFGLARILEDEYYNAQVGAKFPIKWTAPEAASFGKFTNKSDVWSYGILLYELVTKGCVPYPEMCNREVLKYLERGYRMPKPTNVDCPFSLYQMMLQCWDKDPQKRPSFEYLHRYLSEFFVESDFQKESQTQIIEIH